MNDFVLNQMAKHKLDTTDAMLLSQQGTTGGGIPWKLDFGVKVRFMSPDGTRNRAEYCFNKQYGNIVTKSIYDPKFKELHRKDMEETERLARGLDAWCRYITEIAINDLVWTGIEGELSADEITTTRDFSNIVDEAVTHARCVLRAAYDCDDPLFAKWPTDDCKMERGYIARAIESYLRSRTFELYSTRKSKDKTENMIFEMVLHERMRMLLSGH